MWTGGLVLHQEKESQHCESTLLSGLRILRFFIINKDVALYSGALLYFAKTLLLLQKLLSFQGLSSPRMKKRRLLSLRVAMTGASADLGRLVLPRLLSHEGVEAVLSIDADAVALEHPRLTQHLTQLGRAENEPELAAQLTAFRPDVLVHLAFVNSPVHSASFAHELECLGSIHLFAAASQAKVRRLVMPSLTALYGPHPGHPAFLSEETELKGSAESRFIQDRIDVEGHAQAFVARTPQAAACILRFPSIAGTISNNTFTRLLETRLVPTVLGHDPLWQVIHEDDAADALVLAALSTATGTFNVAPSEAIPFSSVVQFAGGRVLPMPWSLLTRFSKLGHRMGFKPVPHTLLAYLRYPCVVDNTKMRQTLAFRPKYSIPEALAALAERPVMEKANK
jgi:UDP-glucose 4-epimerase